MEQWTSQGVRAENLGLTGTSRHHHFIRPPGRASATLPGIPGLPPGSAHPLVWSQTPGCWSIHRLQQRPCRFPSVKDSYKMSPSSTEAPTTTSSHCPRFLAHSLFLANLNNLVSSAVPLLFQLIRAFREHWLLLNPTNPPLTSFHAKKWLLLLTPIPTASISRRTLPLTLEVTKFL